ncbi:MAG TPA: energy transducer TonB [Longimicrobium sp.]
MIWPFRAAVAALCACAAPAVLSAQGRVEHLPVAAFIDSAGLHQALLSAPPAPARSPRRWLFSVGYDSSGALVHVKPLIPRGAAAEYATALAELLRAHTKTRIAPGEGHGEYVWLRSGSAPRVDVAEDLSEQHPELRNQAEIRGVLGRASRRLVASRQDLVGYQTTGVVSFRIGEDGVPSAVEVIRGTEDPDIVRELVAIAEAMRFIPAEIEGIPVAVLVQIPITLELRR